MLLARAWGFAGGAVGTAWGVDLSLLAAIKRRRCRYCAGAREQGQIPPVRWEDQRMYLVCRGAAQWEGEVVV